MTKLEERKNKFIKKAIDKFGNKFKFDNIDYVNMNTPINIVCDIHGVIEITPTNFLESKYGCKLCSKNNKSSNTQINIKFKIFTKDNGIFIVDNPDRIKEYEEKYIILKIEAIPF